MKDYEAFFTVKVGKVIRVKADNEETALRKATEQLEGQLPQQWSLWGCDVELLDVKEIKE